jgi:ABC-type Fe3+-hydroxamate transport system substrate-binding protein
MNVKRVSVFLLALCLFLGLCACGGSNEQTTPTTTEPVQNVADPIDDGKLTYLVTVVDESGRPVPQVIVQLCRQSCFVAVTNDEGIAAFSLSEDDYKASVTIMPEGYQTDTEEFYFADGSKELTITLKPVA